MATGKTENLTPWKPGQSGNPKGKPVGTRSFKNILVEFLDKSIDMMDPFTKEKAKFTAKEAVAMKIVGEAMKGNMSAIKEIRDMVDGPIAQQIEIEDKTIQTKSVSQREAELEKRLAKLGVYESKPSKKTRKNDRNRT